MRNEPAQPFNILLDKLPDNYDGWLIRTDYRIGIQISLCLQDEEMTEEERIIQATYLLFGNGIPPVDKALDGMAWFMNGGQPGRDDVPPSQDPQKMWFDYDHARISASFKKTFGIDIHKTNLHWFEFLSMLDCVDEDSSISHAIQMRGTDTSKMKGKQKRDMDRAKKLLTPPARFTQEEQNMIREFFGE